jgi:peroxin-13
LLPVSVSGYGDLNDVYNGELYGRYPGYFTGLGSTYGGYYGSPPYGVGYSGLGYNNLGYSGLGYGGSGYRGLGYGGLGYGGVYPGYNTYRNVAGYGGYYGRPGLYR